VLADEFPFVATSKSGYIHRLQGNPFCGQILSPAGVMIMHVRISLLYISLRAHIFCYSRRALYSTVCHFTCICASSTHSVVFVKNILSLCSALSRFGRLLMSHIMDG
jgi:hypothetical protein